MTRAPVLFVSHGSPTEALELDGWTEAMARVGRETPRPAAIVAVSAHWVTRGAIGVTAAERRIAFEPHTNLDNEVLAHLLPAGPIAWFWPTPPTSAERERAEIADSSSLDSLADLANPARTRSPRDRIGAMMGKGLRSAVAVNAGGFVAALKNEIDRFRNFSEEGEQE